LRLKNHVSITLQAFILLTLIISFSVPQGRALTWSTDYNLSNDAPIDMSSTTLQTSDGKIWVFWQLMETGSTFDIYYKVYNGTAWSIATQFTTNPANDGNPTAIQARDGKIWVFWTTDRDGPPGNWEIYYKTSSNNGASWSVDTRLTNSLRHDKRPSAMQAADGRIWVVWYSDDNPNNTDELYYNIFDGTWWGLDTMLTYNTWRDGEPSIIQTKDGKIWVFWTSSKTGDQEIFYKTSTNNGVSWSTETQLVNYKNSEDVNPAAIQTRDTTMWVFWQADRSGSDFNIYYKTSSNNGVSWTSDAMFVGTGDEEWMPSECQLENKTMMVTWSSSIYGDFEILYRLGYNPHDVGVTKVAYSPVVNYWVYAGFQNFQVNVTVRNYGVYAETFTVSAKYNSTMMGSQPATLSPSAVTNLTFTWNTAGIPYGHYVISGSASAVASEGDLTDNSLSDGVVTVTMPGDVNFDRIVNVLDVGVVSAHWYPGPPLGALGYDEFVDINKDGSIDLIDVGLISAHYSESW